jgi:hypothetical protein
MLYALCEDLLEKPNVSVAHTERVTNASLCERHFGVKMRLEVCIQQNAEKTPIVAGVLVVGLTG